MSHSRLARPVFRPAAPPACRLFSSVGGCRFGLGCRFHHDVRTILERSVTSSSSCAADSNKGFAIHDTSAKTEAPCVVLASLISEVRHPMKYEKGMCSYLLTIPCQLNMTQHRPRPPTRKTRLVRVRIWQHRQAVKDRSKNTFSPVLVRLSCAVSGVSLWHIRGGEESGSPSRVR